MEVVEPSQNTIVSGKPEYNIEKKLDKVSKYMQRYTNMLQRRRIAIVNE